MGFLVLVALCSMMIPVHAVEIRGTAAVGTEILPAFGLDADFGVTFSGENWQLMSNTNIGLLPAFAGTERITFSYDLDFLKLGASAFTTFVPFAFGQVDVHGTLDLFDLAVGEEDPSLVVSADLTVGTKFNGAIDPYARVSTRFTVGDHWLSNTTTVSFIPADVPSSLLGYVLFGTFDVADGAVTVTTYGYLSTGLVPFDFTYVQANAKVAVEGMSILNSVTYHGNTSVTVRSTVTIDLDPVTVKIMGSYNSAAPDPFGLGLSASVGWGPL